jgi:hypothetical protein
LCLRHCQQLLRLKPMTARLLSLKLLGLRYQTQMALELAQALDEYSS